MNTSPTPLSAHTQKLDQSSQVFESNRIILHGPSTVYDVLKILEGEMKYFSLARTALLRTVVPEWGGPNVAPGKHVSSAVLEFTKSIPAEYLAYALQMQERHFKRIQIDNSSQCRHRHYLKKLVKEARDRRWILPDAVEENEPRLNQINRPRGERRVYANNVRITTLKRPKSYALGKLKEHFIELEDERGNKRKVLANEILERQLLQISCYVKKVRKNGDEYCLNMLKCVLGFLHFVKNIPLNELTLDCFVPFIQLRFSEQDFKDHEDFKTNGNGQFLDPEKVEFKLAMAEALAKRRAEKSAESTWTILEEFFEWRNQELASQGKTEGMENSSKRAFIGIAILCCEAIYQDETKFKKPKRIKRQRTTVLGFDDIPVIVLLRTKYADYPIDTQKIKKRINKTRCIPWPQAMKIFEKQRSLALNYFIDSRDSHRRSGFVRRLRKLSGIAQEFQKASVLGLMLIIPTDRQQTYCDLQFGVNFKNGVFTDEDCEQFDDWGIPTKPNEAKFWINLENFKTADTYGEFWYPVPNVQFPDRTTFYELICAWLWGFEDQNNHWPVCYKDSRWQGYIDDDGNRLGWRAALAPYHDYMFTMPNAKQPFYDQTFYALIRNLFVRFTQEDGRPVPVSPHSIRHMLSNYLDKLEINGEEEKSFSYVLHHSPETHNGRYVYRDNMIKIGSSGFPVEAARYSV